MQDTDIREYLRLCIRYRTATVLLCTVVYLLPPADGHALLPRLWIAFGMLLAGFLSNGLYLFAFQQPAHENWFRILLVLELFSYGIFLFASGGLFSPYLWYYVGSFFMMLSLRRSPVFAVLGLVWCVLCVAFGHLLPMRDLAAAHPARNLATGAVVVIGAFSVVLRYVRRLDESSTRQRAQGLRLRAEIARSEQALRHVTELYDTLNLFAISDPDRVMQELVHLLRRTIATGGCLLVKYDIEGGIERHEMCGVEACELPALLEASVQHRAVAGWRTISGAQLPFEATYIGDAVHPQGVLLRRIQQAEQMQTVFYLSVIEIVFRNLDTHQELETYIAAEEKNRLADEIHDTVIQKLFGLTCGMKMLEQDVDTASKDELKKQLRMLGRAAEMTMTELREAIYGKRFEGGESFTERMQLYMDEMERVSGISIHLVIDEAAGDMTASQKIVLYRISCEAVSNAVCHGRAQQIWIRIDLTCTRIRMEITDNGTGISAASHRALHGNGLRNMKRMATLLGGQILLESRQSKGTTVKLHLPRR